MIEIFAQDIIKAISEYRDDLNENAKYNKFLNDHKKKIEIDNQNRIFNTIIEIIKIHRTFYNGEEFFDAKREAWEEKEEDVKRDERKAYV